MGHAPEPLSKVHGSTMYTDLHTCKQITAPPPFVKS